MKWLPFIISLLSLISLSSAYLYGVQNYGSGCYNQDCNVTESDTSNNNTSPPSSSSGGGGGGGFLVTSSNNQTIPSELLDVTFRILEYAVSSSDDLVTIATFQSFGRNPANVSLKYIIKGQSNETFYSESNSLLVFSEEAVTKKFEGLNLSEGEYEVELEVEFAGFTERFEAKFRIGSIAFSPVRNQFIFWGIIPLLLLVILIILEENKKKANPPL